jgi:hypothetical protein
MQMQGRISLQDAGHTHMDADRFLTMMKKKNYLLLADMPYCGEIAAVFSRKVHITKTASDLDRLVLRFTDGKELILETTNLERMIQGTGTAETDEWRGVWITVDAAPHPERPNVTMRLITVHPRNEAAPATRDVTEDEIPF